MAETNSFSLKCGGVLKKICWYGKATESLKENRKVNLLQNLNLGLATEFTRRASRVDLCHHKFRIKRRFTNSTRSK